MYISKDNEKIYKKNIKNVKKCGCDVFYLALSFVVIIYGGN